MDTERRRLLEMAADFLMEEGDNQLPREQWIAFLDDPKNAAILEDVRFELIMDERISGEISLDSFDDSHYLEPETRDDQSASGQQIVRRPNVLRRGIARYLRWSARRLRAK